MIGQIVRSLADILMEQFWTKLQDSTGPRRRWASQPLGRRDDAMRAGGGSHPTNQSIVQRLALVKC
jgi:hypothetical protein